MTKLCFKNNATVKKYDLKDSANKPRLAVKHNGVTKYLSLKQGNKNGELHIKLGGQTYYVQRKPYVDINSGTADLPIRGTLTGNRSSGALACWPIYTEDKTILAMIVTGYGDSRSSSSDGGAGCYGTMFTDPSSNTTLYNRVGFNFKPCYYDNALWKIATVSTYGGNSGSAPSNIISTLVSHVKNKLLGNYSGFTNINYVLQDFSATDSTWQTKTSLADHRKLIKAPDYTGADLDYGYNWYSSPGAGHYIAFRSSWADNSDHTKRYLNLYAQCTSYHASSGVGWDAYIEFPDMGLLGCTPEEVITEWAAALGNNYNVYTTDP